MERSGDWEQKINLVNELTEGMELAKQLQMHLNDTTTATASSSSSANETRESLVGRILNSYDKALSMLRWNIGALGDHHPHMINTVGAAAIGRSESPRSFSGSPHSDDSDQELKDHEPKTCPRKSVGFRKSVVAQWTKQVQICPGTGLEGPLDDGFSWRKYGQKDILGAKYPRGYYRCTHRNVQGCLATKQVQRSDENPTIFEVTYRGRHTCISPPASHLAPPHSSPEKQEPNTALNRQLLQPPHLHHHQPETQSDHFQTSPRAFTSGIDAGNQLPLPSSLYFSPPSHAEAEGSYFRSGSFPDNNLMMGSFSPPFMAPATSAANYFSVSPPNETTGAFGRNQTFQGMDSELRAIVSSGNSATVTPTAGFDLHFGGSDQFHEPSFQFDDPRFF